MTFKHLIVVVFIVICTAGSVSYQTAEPATPSASPAPSKTPATSTITPASGITATQDDLGIFTPDPTPIEPLTQEDLAVLVGNVQRPNGIAWHNGNLYTACSGDWTIYEVNDTTAATITYVFGPRSVHTLVAETDPDDAPILWIPDFESNTLTRVDSQRTPEIISSNLNGPWGITSLDADDFLITNLLGNNITKINRAGESEIIASGLRSPSGIATSDNLVFVANNGSARRAIEWFDIESLIDVPDAEIEPQPLVSGLQNTTNLVFGPDDYLYFTYALGTRGVVGRVNPEQCRANGGCTNSQIEIVLYTELAAPLAGLTITPDMRLFVHTIFRPEIYWVQLEDSSVEQG